LRTSLEAKEVEVLATTPQMIAVKSTVRNSTFAWPLALPLSSLEVAALATTPEVITAKSLINNQSLT